MSKKLGAAEREERKRLAAWMDAHARASRDSLLVTRAEYEEAIARVLRGGNALEDK